VSRAPLAIALLILAGCGGGARITPPSAPAEPVGAFVVDYGRHSSLLLPSPFDGKLHEYAFGDFDWFALNYKAWDDAVEALFASTGGALGHRTLDPLQDTEQLADAARAERVLQFYVERERAAKLLERLQTRYEKHGSTRVFNPSSSLYFVRDDERYSWANNCNHVTARWLEALGCKLRGSRMTSKFKFEKKG
jgi:hypothetical protein